ncbi:MAG TPA: 50S ribosomal protein L30e [archaeon]|nr:50S ribosomal protein L30e [archaeon]
MTLNDDIRTALKTGKIILGYRRSIRYVKNDKPKKVVMARNAPERMRNEVEHNSKIAGTQLETFDGSSIDLGVLCGKPFPVAVLAIK